MPILSPLPFNLTNGTTADATQVMADLLSMFTNVNNYAAPLANAYLTSPIITGGSSTGSSIVGATIDSTSTGVTQSPLSDNINLATNEYVDHAVAAAMGPAAAGTLTGTTLASNVINSSLQTLGILTSLEVSGLGLFDSNLTVLGHSSLDSGHLTTDGAGTITVGSLGTAVTGVTQAAHDNSTKLATTAYADNAGAGGGSGLGIVYVKNSTNGVATLNIPANSIPLFAFCTSTIAPTYGFTIDAYMNSEPTPPGIFTLGSGSAYTNMNYAQNLTGILNGQNPFPQFPFSTSAQTFTFYNTNGFPNWYGATLNLGVMYITVS